MFEKAANLFVDRKNMLKRLKKKTYEERMKEFREQNKDFFGAMTSVVDNSDDKKESADKVSKEFVDSVWNEFSKNNKISGVLQFDLNLFMIYFVFPAILLTYSDVSKLLCDSLCAEWNSRLKSGHIGYMDYDKIYNSFNEKILGLF